MEDDGILKTECEAITSRVQRGAYNVTHEAKFVIDAFMEALDGIRAIINDEHGTPEEVVFRVNEALRIGHEFLNKDVERLNEIIRKGEWHGEDVKMGK